MNDKDIPVWKKIIFSIFFPFFLLFHCMLFLIGKNKQEKIWWNNIIYNIREEYDKDSFTVIGYSFFPLILGSVIYIVFCICGTLSWNPIAFFSIALTVTALLVSIIIALTLKKKTIESGSQFINQLYIHINYLKHLPKKKDEKHILYIIAPNINIGTGINYSFATAIKNNKEISFKFICKTVKGNSLDKYPTGDNNERSIADKKRDFFKNKKNNMLEYLYDKYHKNLDKLDTSINELKEILKIESARDGNVEIIEKYDELYSKKEIGGYISDKECLLGLYDTIKGDEGKVIFRGETIVSSEFIEIVKNYIEEKTK
jgi:hypothetical protein